MEFILQGIINAIHLLAALDSETYAAIGATLRASTYSMLVTLMVGIPSGFCLGYFNFPAKKQIRLAVDTLLALPTVFIGLLVYALLSRQAPLGDLSLLFTLPGIAIGQTLLALPIVMALTATAIETMDTQLHITLISLGANRRQLMLTSLWESRYSVLAAAVTAYGRVLTEVGISMMVGGNIKWHTRTITTAIALETNKGRFDMGIALGLVLMSIAFIVNCSVSFLRKR